MENSASMSIDKLFGFTHQCNSIPCSLFSITLLHFLHFAINRSELLLLSKRAVSENEPRTTFISADGFMLTAANSLLSIYFVLARIVNNANWHLP